MNPVPDFLQNGNGLLLAGIGLLLIGSLLLVRWVVKLAQVLAPRHPPRAMRPRVALLGRSLHLLVALLFLALAAAGLFAGMSIRTYQTFTQEERIGTAECLSFDPLNKLLVIRFSPNEAALAQTYSLAGDQWELSAHILKWDPPANLLGLHTAYRLHQIKGVYLEAADENTRPHRAYALSPGRDWLWSTLERYGAWLPGVEAVYGNAVSSSARPGDQFEVRVTTSGLILKRLNP